MTALQELPVRNIIRAIADASARWADADFPPRVRVLDAITTRTGYSMPVVEYALDRLFESITESALIATTIDELGSLKVLDGFCARKDRPSARALPIGRVAVISSRTTIGVAIAPAIFALCAKNDVLVKDREDHLVAAFFRTLSEEHDAFTASARAESWSGPEKALHGFSGVVAFGTNDTLDEIRNACAPDARFVGFGPKASAGYIARESLHSEQLARTIANDAARDLVLYESEGCLSLHVLFVERGGTVSPEQFMSDLQPAIERAQIEFPIGTRDARVNARLVATRDLAAFRTANATERRTTRSDEQLSYFLALDPPRTQAPFLLPCSLPIFTVNGPADAYGYLDTHGISLEALAIDVARPDIIELAERSGASRIARFGALQNPLLEAHHGGRSRITDFVRWISNET